MDLYRCLWVHLPLGATTTKTTAAATTTRGISIITIIVSQYTPDPTDIVHRLWILSILIVVEFIGCRGFDESGSGHVLTVDGVGTVGNIIVPAYILP